MPARKSVKKCPSGKIPSKTDWKHRCIQHNTRHSCLKKNSVLNEGTGRCNKKCKPYYEAIGRRRAGQSTLCVKKCTNGQVRGTSRRCAKACPKGMSRVARIRKRDGKKMGSVCRKD